MPDEISIVRMLNDLVRTPLSDLDQAVTRTIGDLATHIGAGWGVLFRLDGAILTATHRYTQPSLSDPPCRPDYALGPGRAVLERNQPLLIADLSVLPEDSPLRAQDWA